MNKTKETERQFEIIDGKKFEYPCYKKGHQHSLDCCTPAMWNAASDTAYAESK